MSKRLSANIQRIFEKCGFYVMEGYPKQYVYNPRTGTICRIVSSHSAKELKPWISSRTGYLQVKLKVGKRTYKNISIHRLAAQFLQNANGKKFIHHIDGNKLNNSIENLIFVTRKEHSVLHVLMREGDQEQYDELISRIQRDNKERVQIVA